MLATMRGRENGQLAGSAGRGSETRDASWRPLAGGMHASRARKSVTGATVGALTALGRDRRISDVRIAPFTATGSLHRLRRAAT